MLKFTLFKKYISVFEPGNLLEISAGNVIVFVKMIEYVHSVTFELIKYYFTVSSFLRLVCSLSCPITFSTLENVKY